LNRNAVPAPYRQVSNHNLPGVSAFHPAAFASILTCNTEHQFTRIRNKDKEVALENFHFMDHGWMCAAKMKTPIG
jgi:hypothetical protein